MKSSTVNHVAQRLLLLAMMSGTLPAFAADSPVPDPPNGFHAKALNATRLSPEQKKQLKLVSHPSLAPFYPKEAALAGRTGKVVLDLLIDADGNVKDTLVLDENPLGLGFGEAAIAVVTTYKFANPYGTLVIFTAMVPFSP